MTSDQVLQPLVESDEVTDLREDHARLRVAFAESVAEERTLRQALAESVAEVAALRQEAARLTRQLAECEVEADDVRGRWQKAAAQERVLAAALRTTSEDLRRVLASPSFRIGSAVTAAPRYLRGRRRRWR